MFINKLTSLLVVLFFSGVSFKVAAQAEITLTGNGNPIDKGSTTAIASNGTDFGNGNACSPVTLSRSFTIANTGTSPLYLTGSPIINISGSPDFSVTTQPTDNALNGGASVTFTVTYTSNKAGLQTSTIVIANSDSDESQYNFVVQANGGNTNSSPSWEVIGANALGAGSYQHLAFHPINNEPYVAFQDVNNNWQTSVRRFNGVNWVNVGIGGFSNGEAYNQKIAFHPITNEPYVAFKYGFLNGKINVMRFNGSSWVAVGVLNARTNSEFNMSFHPTTGEPHLAFLDSDNQYKIAVIKFNGSTWANVGTQDITSSQAGTPSLAFHPTTNQPYIAYGYYGQTLIKKLNGTTWEMVGAAQAAGGSHSLAFNTTTQEPYVAYTITGSTNSNRISVIRFNGTNWVNVGFSEFSNSSSFSPSLRFHPNSNEPYLAYQEAYSKIMLQRFDGQNWVTVGTHNVALTFGNLAFHPVTQEPHIAYVGAVARFGMPTLAPEVEIRGNGRVIPSGSTVTSLRNATDFGAVDFCTPMNTTRTFSIYNVGMGAMKLLGTPMVTIAGSPNFSVTMQPSTNTIAGCGAAVSFAVSCSGDFIGEQSAVVTVKTNDTDENTYTFVVRASRGLAQGTTDWVPVGQEGFSDITDYTGEVIFHPMTNEPYAVYTYQNGSSIYLAIKRFDGTQWVDLPSPPLGIITDGFRYSMAFNPITGEPYLAFNGYYNSPTVHFWLLRFDGTNWVSVGTTPVFPTSVQDVALAFHPITNEPYISFIEGQTSSYKVRVMRFDGLAWKELLQYSTYFNTEGLGLTFDPLSTNLFLVYNETNSFGYRKTTVQKFDATTWSSVGDDTYLPMVYGAKRFFMFQPTVKGVDRPVPSKLHITTDTGVFRLDGNTWVKLGRTMSYLSALAFHPVTREPYSVEMVPQMEGAYLVIGRFDGVKWVRVGSVIPNISKYQPKRIAFHPITNEPYVCFLRLPEGNSNDMITTNSKLVVNRLTVKAISEIDITNETGVSIPSTSSTSTYVDFGATTTTQTTITRTFSIKNLGSAPLTVFGTPIVNLTGSPNFKVTAQPAANTTVIAPCAAPLSFTITYTRAAGSTTEETTKVVIYNDDSNEGPYFFNLKATNSAIITPVNGENNVLQSAKVEGNVQEAMLGVYPNPANTEVNIVLGKQFVAVTKIEVLDNLGRTVLEKTVSSQELGQTQVLPIGHLMSGGYILRVTSENAVSNVKLIKQ